MDVVSANVPMLQLCLDPHPPKVFSARNAPRRLDAMTARPPKTSQGSNPRFRRTAVAPNFRDVEPGQIPYRIRPNTTSETRDLTHHSILLAQLKSDESFVGDMERKLHMYGNAAESKKIIREQDYIDHFYRPLQYRIKDEMTPAKYLAMKVQRDEAIRKMDEHPIPIRARQSLPKIPCVSVTQKGLRDPAYRYVQHRESERRLEEFIARSNGMPLTARVKRPENMLDYAMYDMQQHTRFFYGRTEEANKYGRRTFAMHNSSKVDRATDMFGGPLP